MKQFLLRIIRYFLRLGFFINKAPNICTSSKEFEKISYSPDYYKVINSHLIQLDYFKFLRYQYEFNDTLFLEKNSFIHHESGGVVSRHKIIKHTLLNTYGYIFNSGIFKYVLPFKLYRLNVPVVEAGFLLCGNMSYNFFHFLIDSLPRITNYLELIKNDENIKLIVNYPKKFTLEYLALLGVPEKNCLFIDSNVFVKRLFFSNNKFTLSSATLVFPNFIYSKRALMGLSEFLESRAAHCFEGRKWSDKIYITRNDVKTRVLSNEDMVFEILREYGFDFINLSELKIADQIELFLNSKVVVTVHGASLANLIFLKKALLIEFFPFNKKLSTLYQMQQLSQIWNNRHILFVCDHVTDSQDITVDLTLLRQVINSETDFFKP